MTTEARAEIIQLHNRLGLALRQEITPDELKQLLHYFLGCGLGRREQDNIKDFLDLWQKLDLKKIIEQRKYSKLKDAFQAINAAAHLEVIREFEELMTSADGLYDGWIIDNKTVESVEELYELMEKYEELLHDRRGVVLNNAVFRHITSEGGELQLRNGTAKLQVPRNAIRKHDHETFWIFRAPAESNGNLRIKSTRARDIIRCSLPFRLGPAELSFKIPVILTLRDHSLSKIRSRSDTAMSIYRKKDGGKLWMYLGSCFCDPRNLTATAQVKKFSSYVLGLPATVDTHLLNVHMLVGYKLAEYMDVSVLNVFFLMNEYSYVSEFVQKHKLFVITETCLYLDTQKDVAVAVVSQDESIHQCLRKDQLRGLAEFPVQIDIPRSIVRHDENATLNLMQDEKLLLHCLPLGTKERKPNSPDTNVTEATPVSKVSATKMAPVDCEMSVRKSVFKECEKSEVEMRKEKDVLAAGCAKTNQSVDDASTSAKPAYQRFASGSKTQLLSKDIRPSHEKLVSDLEMQLASEDTKRLKRYFIDCSLASIRDLESVPDDIVELFPLLEQKMIIGLGDYGNLKDALKAVGMIGETESVRVIEKFEARIKQEATMMAPLERSSSEQTSECEKMEVEKWKGSADKDSPVAGCAKTNRSVDKASTSAMYMPPNKKLASSLEMHLSLEGTIPSHKKLVSDLEMQLTSVEIRRLKSYFNNGRFVSRRDLENVPDDILELFPLLERKNIIDFGKYGYLKDALKAIGETESVHVIEKFEMKLQQEAILLLRKLASDLEKDLKQDDVKRLKRYFKDRQLASQSDLDSVSDDILELLSLLEQKKIIEPGKYCKLKDALKTINKMDCICIIEDFEERFWQEVAAGGVDMPTAKYMKDDYSGTGSASACPKS